MKKFFLLLPVSLLFNAAFAQKKATVSGKVTSSAKIEKVYLAYRAGEENFSDSAEVKNGSFSFQTSVQEPVLAQLRTRYPAADGGRPAWQLKQFYIEPGEVKINISDSLKNAKIKGGKSQRDYEDLNTLLDPLNEKSKDLRAKYSQYAKDKDEDGMKALQKEFEAIREENEELNLKFIKNHTNSPVALSVLKDYAGYSLDPAEISPLFNSLSNPVRNSKAGKAFSEQIELARKTAVGAMAMEFTQNDTLGKPVSLSDFRGKYVLVDFWASWCGPCRAENPNVVNAFNQYKDKNFTVLGISLDGEEQKQAWMKAIHKDNLTWTQVSDLKGWANEVAQQYGIRAIPQNLLIDPNGKIVAKNIRGEELGKTLSEVLD